MCCRNVQPIIADLISGYTTTKATPTNVTLSSVT